MKENRWLLPFTQGVDIHAIEQVVQRAESANALLVPVALIPVSQGRQSPAVRQEYLRQAEDFLEVMRRKTARHHVSIECHEAFTANVGRCMMQLIQDLHCRSIVLAVCEQQGRLLQTDEVACLLANPPASLVLVRLPGHRQDSQRAHPVARLWSWVRKLNRQQGERW